MFVRLIDETCCMLPFSPISITSLGSGLPPCMTLGTSPPEMSTTCWCVFIVFCND